MFQLGVRPKSVVTLLAIPGFVLLVCSLAVAMSFDEVQASDQKLHELKIEWPKSTADDTVTRFRSAMLRAGQVNSEVNQLVEKIDQSRVPVLIPFNLLDNSTRSLAGGNEPELNGQYAFTLTESGFAAVVKEKNFDFLCRGHGTTLLPEGVTVASLQSTSEPKISGNNLGGYVASFRRYGATYACEIICKGASADDDDMCAKPATLQSLIDSLVFVGSDK